MAVAFSYLSEDAQLWHRTWKKAKEGTDDYTYEKLIEGLIKRFVPSTSDNILQAEWEKIQQHKDGRTQPITKIAAELSHLALQLPEMRLHQETTTLRSHDPSTSCHSRTAMQQN